MHIIASLALYTHYNLRNTDKSCSQNIRKSSFDSFATNVLEKDFVTFKHTLGNLSTAVGFSWLLRTEPEPNASSKFQLNSIKEFVVHQNHSKNVPLYVLPVSIDLINSTKRQLYDMYNDEYWNDISRIVKAITTKNDINMTEKKNQWKISLNTNRLKFNGNNNWSEF